MYAGLDWAGKGWFAVVHDGDGWDAGFYPTILNFWHAHDVERALIDIPVGLTDDERRDCDAAASDYLESAASSVFGTPVREAVYAENIRTAKRVHEERDVGSSISNQAWAIVPRIREVDVFLRTYSVGRRLRESHPEVCFAALTGGDALDSDKQTDDGRADRLALLEAEFSNPDEFLEDVESRFMEPSYAPVVGKSARDDVVDAMVLAATARAGDLVQLPEDPQVDELLNREIEIVRPPERPQSAER